MRNGDVEHGKSSNGGAHAFASLICVRHELVDVILFIAAKEKPANPNSRGRKKTNETAIDACTPPVTLVLGWEN